MDFNMDKIRNMTPNELHTYNQTLGKRLLKRIAITTAAKAAVVVAVIVVTDRISAKYSDEDTTK